MDDLEPNPYIRLLMEEIEKCSKSHNDCETCPSEKKRKECNISFDKILEHPWHAPSIFLPYYVKLKDAIKAK